MIERITLTEYNRIQRNRKMEDKRFSKATMWPGIYFKGKDGHYYRNTKSGPAAALEVARFHTKIIRQNKAQQSLL